MAVDFRELVSALDRDEDVHLARILVLLNRFRREDRPAIEGITKLAKLDFLLRYPAALRRALEARGVKPGKIPVDDHERLTIEARMIRFRYGPWDHRYRRFLNILAARGFVTLRTDGRTIQIDLTPKGHTISSRLISGPAFARVDERAKLLRTHLDLGATRLMEFIYEHFPEIVSFEYSEPIGALGGENEDDF